MAKQFVDVVVVTILGVRSFVEFVGIPEGATVNYIYAEKTPTNPQETTADYMTVNLYYIAEINDVGVYANGEWEYMSITGVISDIGEATEEDAAYAIIIDDGGETPEQPETPTKKFTRLYLGEVAYSSNGKRFRKLQREEYVEPSEPETESVVGTWVFNSTFIDTPSDYTVNDINGTFYIPNDFTTDYYFIETSIDRILFSNNSILVYRKSNTYMNNVRGDGTATCYYYKYNSWDYSPLPYNVEDVLARTITITEEPTDETFKTWLLANATRVEDSIIGTWVFKPTIDLSTSFAMHINFTGELRQVGYIGNFECEIIVVNSSGIFYRPIGASSAYQAYSTNSQDWKDYEYRRTITITGGADIENKEFITWLKANAMRVDESIIGTWYFNDTIDFSAYDTNHPSSASPATYINIDFVSNGETYNQFIMTESGTLGWGLTYKGDTNAYTYIEDNSRYWKEDLIYQTIEITGGSAINDEKFVNWLNANATKIA